jgi:hypothetical protein
MSSMNSSSIPNSGPSQKNLREDNFDNSKLNKKNPPPFQPKKMASQNNYSQISEEKESFSSTNSPFDVYKKKQQTKHNDKGDDIQEEEEILKQKPQQETKSPTNQPSTTNKPNEKAVEKKAETDLESMEEFEESFVIKGNSKDIVNPDTTNNLKPKLQTSSSSLKDDKDLYSVKTPFDAIESKQEQSNESQTNQDQTSQSPLPSQEPQPMQVLNPAEIEELPETPQAKDLSNLIERMYINIKGGISETYIVLKSVMGLTTTIKIEQMQDRSLSISVDSQNEQIQDLVRNRASEIVETLSVKKLGEKKGIKVNTISMNGKTIYSDSIFSKSQTEKPGGAENTGQNKGGSK